MKQSFVFLGILSCCLVGIVWCSSSSSSSSSETFSENLFVFTWESPVAMNSYRVWQRPIFTDSLYGTVVVQDIKTIVSNKAGILEYFDCQPGKTVTPTTLIAKIVPHTQDPSYRTARLQYDTLQQQLRNLQSLYTLTDATLRLQKSILQEQYATNQQLLSLLSSSQDATQRSLWYQQDILNQQRITTQTSYDVDKEKMKTSIANAYKQNLIMIKDALRKVYDLYTWPFTLSDKDPQLKQEILSRLTILQDKTTQTMSSEAFSQYLNDVVDFLWLVQRGVQATTPTSQLPQSSTAWLSLDSLSSTFTTLANTFMSSKSAFDTLLASYQSLHTTYSSQLRIMDINMRIAQEVTPVTTNNQLETQRINLEWAQKTLAYQLDISDKNLASQLANLKNQILTLQQNIASISYSLEDDVLYAWVEGVVKMKSVGEDNKVAPNTALCQIMPTHTWSMYINVFSYQRLPLWKRVGIINSAWVFLFTGKITYEFPYKDAVTQQYMYTIPLEQWWGKVHDQEKVRVVVAYQSHPDDIWIPLEYVIPRLEGYFVQRKRDNSYEEVNVILWNIHDTYVQILSGISVWDELVK